MNAIEIRKLSFTYQLKPAISDVDLVVPPGSLFGFLGPNGAGKTTTIRVLLGFLHARVGSAHMLGLDCWHDSAQIKRDVGFIPGDLRLWPWLTGHSALRLFGSVRGMDLRTEGRRVADVLELNLDLKVRKMSKGTRQKLGLVLAFCHRPKLLVLDEPSSGLDPLMQDRFRGLCKAARDQGSTVFLSSHTLSEVENVCERVAIVRAGRIIATDTLEALKRRAGHDVMISWRAGASPHGEPPAGFVKQTLAKPDHGPSQRVWHAHFSGDLASLTRWLGEQSLDDVSIARPDLESLFRGYYENSPVPSSLQGAGAGR